MDMLMDGVLYVYVSIEIHLLTQRYVSSTATANYRLLRLRPLLRRRPMHPCLHAYPVPSRTTRTTTSTYEAISTPHLETVPAKRSSARQIK
jgi:hypothetical protein